MININEFKPRGLPTAIGSMPHTDPETALSLILDNLPDLPVWPQLPQRAPLENMYIQYSEGLPGVVLTDQKIYIDRSTEIFTSKEMEGLYIAYMENASDNYTTSPEYAAGLQLFLKQKLDSALAVKGQVTGPISFGLVVTDQDRRPTLYDEVLADVIAKHLRLKAVWQEKELAKVSHNTIIFLDEPYLASLGSAFVALSSDMVVNLTNEALSGISGLKGMHCCGNTDWSVLMSTNIDILSFDAYNYGYSLPLYPDAVHAFLDRDGVIAWGIVPNEEEPLNEESADSLIKKLDNLMGLLSDKGIRYDILLERSLITPSCGLGSTSPEAAAKALRLTAEVSSEFRHLHNIE